jgi:hypothetical protein
MQSRTLRQNLPSASRVMLSHRGQRARASTGARHAEAGSDNSLKRSASATNSVQSFCLASGCAFLLQGKTGSVEALHILAARGVDKGTW